MNSARIHTHAHTHLVQNLYTFTIIIGIQERRMKTNESTEKEEEKEKKTNTGKMLYEHKMVCCSEKRKWKTYGIRSEHFEATKNIIRHFVFSVFIRHRGPCHRRGRCLSLSLSQFNVRSLTQTLLIWMKRSNDVISVHKAHARWKNSNKHFYVV